MNLDRPLVQRFADAQGVAQQAAEDALSLIAHLLINQPRVNLCVTGGTVGIATLAEMASQSSSFEIDYGRLHVWWGDERFVASDDSARNALQARKAWLNKVAIPTENIHEFPSADNDLDIDDAAAKFNDYFADQKPKFDLVFLGMGPDGHINSLFPQAEIPAPGVFVIAEHDSPKPPKFRLSFTYEVVNSADRVWIIVAGADKQDAVAVAFGDNSSSLPIGKVRGKNETKWYLDSTAATKVFGC
ncbi:MAG: 6-phosphogluconolactonase [Rhodoluna sp.]